MGHLVIRWMFVLHAGRRTIGFAASCLLQKRSIFELFQEAWQSHGYNPPSNADAGTYR